MVVVVTVHGGGGRGGFFFFWCHCGAECRKNPMARVEVP
jgi:hypothetical protein